MRSHWEPLTIPAHAHYLYCKQGFAGGGGVQVSGQDTSAGTNNKHRRGRDTVLGIKVLVNTPVINIPY